MPQTVYTQDIRIGDVIRVGDWTCKVIDIDKLTVEPSIYDIYLFLHTIETCDSPYMQLNLRYGIPMTVTRE